MGLMDFKYAHISIMHNEMEKKWLSEHVHKFHKFAFVITYHLTFPVFTSVPNASLIFSIFLPTLLLIVYSIEVCSAETFPCKLIL